MMYILYFTNYMNYMTNNKQNKKLEKTSYPLMLEENYLPYDNYLNGNNNIYNSLF